MDSTLVHGATSSHEGLRRYLPAKDTLTVLARLGATKDIYFNGFKVEQVDEEIERGGHALIVGGDAIGGHGGLSSFGEHSTDISKRLPLGHCYRGAPNRGQQHQFRLVAL